MRRKLGTGHRYYSWGDSWGWHLGVSRYGFTISTPFLELKLERRDRWYGERTCVACGEGHSGAHPDPCLGELGGVDWACCGHGRRDDSYITFKNGVTICGFAVREPYPGAFDVADFISDLDPEELRSRVVDITIPVHVDNLETAEDYENLARFAVMLALDDIDHAKKIQRAAGITPRSTASGKEE